MPSRHGIVQTITKFLKTLKFRFDLPQNWCLLCYVRTKLTAPPLTHITRHQKIVGIIPQEKNLNILGNLQETEDLVLAAICFFPFRGFVKARSRRFISM